MVEGVLEEAPLSGHVLVSRKTLSGWMMQTGELLVLVNAAIYREVAAEGYMQVDESPVPGSDPDIPGASGKLYTHE